MPYLEELIQRSMQLGGQQMNVNQSWIGLPEGAAYSSFYPEWEVTTPQYPTPNPWSLAQMGYRTNELVYTCINVRADSVSEAPLWIYDNRGETPEEIVEHKIRELLADPLPGISEQSFWKIVETYLCIAGFSAWEKERNNLGDVIRLWPMRPDWCSFLRGQQKPVRAIRYQPYGLPFLDIPIEDIVLFAYFDPLYPLLKPFSPTMAALNMVDVDNNMTIMLNNFIKNGAFLGGILTTEQQVLDEASAKVYKDRWKDSHGGAKHAGEIAVLGKGLKYEKTNDSFRDMVFPEVDARSEARITMTFRVPPMLIGAKIGIDRSTYTNYPEARKGFYEGPISSEWNLLASMVRDQLVPDFENEPKHFFCEFDTTDVKALQEDRTARWDRGIGAARAGVITRDEAREELGFDPIDNEPVFIYASLTGETKELPDESNTVDSEEVPAPLENKPTQEEIDLMEAEEKKYRSFAKRRIKEGAFADLGEYEFKYVPDDRQDRLVKEFQAVFVLAELKEAVNA